ncbi:MAG: DUF1080 domain-containing protein [Aureliella sp.]
MLAKPARSDENSWLGCLRRIASDALSDPTPITWKAPYMTKQMNALSLVSSVIFAATLLVGSAGAADPVSAPKESGEMKKLFNGKDLSGWDGDERLWSVQKGVIHGETTKGAVAKGNTFLIWEGEVKDFELRLSFRCSRENNSGIQYRSERVTEKPSNKWVVKGYQHEIRNSNELPNVAGFIYGEKLGRGRVCLVGEKAVATGRKKRDVTSELITKDEFKKLFKLDDWNDVVIVAKGRHIQHYLNGRLIMDFTDTEEDALTEGVLALQLHAGVPMWAEFKDIRLKNLK